MLWVVGFGVVGYDWCVVWFDIGDEFVFYVEYDVGIEIFVIVDEDMGD